MTETPKPMLFVAVPSGLVDGDNQACVRVLVVPRFTEGSITEQGLTDWPGALDEADFRLQTRTAGGDPFEALEPVMYQHGAHSTIWNEFFGGSGGDIEPWRPRTRPASTVVETYTQARAVTDTLHAVTTELAKPDADAGATIQGALTPWGSTEAPPEPELSDPPTIRVLDFHRTVSMLREHPAVLTSLGMVFELRFPASLLDVGGPEAGHSLSIHCPNTPFIDALVTSPWTRYEFGLGIFRPAPGPGSTTGVAHGFLDLTGARVIQPSELVDEPGPPPAWALINFDVDGALAGLREAGRAVLDPNVSAPATMPGIRSIGISLLRPGRRAELAARAQRGEQHAVHQSMASAELTADDLVLGYRVDIRKGDNPWRSLCERNAVYIVNGDVSIPDGGPVTQAPVPLAEEGQVKPFTAVMAGHSDLLTDEVVLRWDGWSLALPIIKLVDDPADIPRDPNPDLPYQFTWTLTPRASRLPTLRFAHRYQMRIRIADLAGGGLTLDDIGDDDSFATPVFTYTRCDPIPPPVLHSDITKFGTGAAIDRMVVRSAPGLTPEELQAIDPDYPASETRQLLPPTAPLALIEQHGLLDQLSDETSWGLAERAVAAQPGLPDPAMTGVHGYIVHEDGGAPTDLSARMNWTPAWPEFVPKSIELTAAPTDVSDPITLAWADNLTLKVTLREAEQATIELTSTIRDDFGSHFSFSEWLTKQGISNSETVNGRNPAVTPPRRLLVVHAVRRPLADPRWKLPADKIVRTEHTTSVLLQPDFTTASGGSLDTDSTGQLDVAAQWAEIDDAGPVAAMNIRPTTVEHLFSASIARGDPPNLSIRHEFGDTKYRSVLYTLNAITRFRDCFKVDEPDELFHISLEQRPEVTVLSSARPAPLRVLAVGPAFAWQPPQRSGDRIEHVRAGRRIRVELARPWFQTGDEERLGVIVTPAGTSPASDDPVTQMGRDPLFDAPSTARYPSAEVFRTTAGTATLAPLPELGRDVMVVPFAVTPDGDRWYADVELAFPDAAPPYNPMVQLALGRFQQNSLPGLELSSVTIADKVPVLPDRRVVVERNGDQLVVTVSGAGPGQPNRIDATIEQAADMGIAADHIDLVATGPTADGIPSWMPMADSAVHGDLGSALPPLTLPRVNGPLRLRLTESEANLGSAGKAKPVELNRRNVFIDTIDIPAAWLQ